MLAGHTRVFLTVTAALSLLSAVATAERAATWVGQTAQMEAHLRTAEIVRIEEIGTGVTQPRRAHVKPSDPFESFVWKPLPPGRRNGYWESYKSEIAAYELDKLLGMNMVPPAVERVVDGKVGAAVMWVEIVRSVKQTGGKVPTGAVWGGPLRKMMLFDNLIGNSDRNAGNILLGEPGDLILIDHSRAFVVDKKLPNKVERVDRVLWERVKALTREELTSALGAWLDPPAIGAMLERRDRMAAAVDKLVRQKGQALVLIPE